MSKEERQKTASKVGEEDKSDGDLLTPKGDLERKISSDQENNTIDESRGSSREVKSSDKAVSKRVFTKESMAKLLAYSFWVVVAFYGVQLVVSLLIFLLPDFSLQPSISVELESFLISSIIFASTLLVLILVPAKLFKSPVKGKILSIVGLGQRLPRWRDIGLAILAYVSCFAAAIGLAIAVQVLVPGFDMNQAQSLPFDQTQFYAGLSLIWIYLTLGVAAPVGEELIFRGYLFGKLRKIMPASITIVVTALVFSMLHVVGVGDDGSFRAQWNVVVAILPLSIGLGILREYTGSVWASIILHSIQNTISFALLFIVLPAQGLF